jgi:hypothetical protein
VLTIRKDGVDALTLPTLTTSWNTATVTFTATNVMHTISIYNSTTTATGNDLGLDDIMMEVQQLPLPLSLVAFDLTGRMNSIDLSWTTLKEENNKGFDIEHSVDGKNWKSIGFVKSKATDMGRTEYQFTDNAPLNGINFYRLKQTDFDGLYDYSQVRSKCLTFPDEITIYPNPATGYVKITGLQVGEQISIYNIAGKKVTELITRRAVETVDLRQLSEGIYYIHILGNEGELHRKKIMATK